MSYVAHPPAASTKTPAQLVAAAELSTEARVLLKPTHTAREYVDLLTARGLHSDAVAFLAHAMPRREAIWWAWACARRAAGEHPEPTVQAALQATESWIAQPTEEHRRAAAAAAERADFGTPAGCAGLAAFFSGGSIAPPNLPATMPTEFMTAKAVTGAVSLAAVEGDAAGAAARLELYLRQGLDVASRIGLWGVPAEKV